MWWKWLIKHCACLIITVKKLFDFFLWKSVKSSNELSSQLDAFLPNTATRIKSRIDYSRNGNTLELKVIGPLTALAEFMEFPEFRPEKVIAQKRVFRLRPKWLLTRSHWKTETCVQHGLFARKLSATIKHREPFWATWTWHSWNVDELKGFSFIKFDSVY